MSKSFQSLCEKKCSAATAPEYLRHCGCCGKKTWVAVALVWGVIVSAWAQSDSNWVHFPPQASPRQPHVIVIANEQPVFVQYPPAKSIEMGVRSEPTYSDNQRTFVVNYPDGTSNTYLERAESVKIRWAEDHTTRVRVMSFSDGTQHELVDHIPGRQRPASYEGQNQIFVTDFADGTSSRTTSQATDHIRSLTKDKKYLIDTYTFPDDFVHQELTNLSTGHRISLDPPSPLSNTASTLPGGAAEPSKSDPRPQERSTPTEQSETPTQIHSIQYLVSGFRLMGKDIVHEAEILKLLQTWVGTQCDELRLQLAAQQVSDRLLELGVLVKTQVLIPEPFSGPR